MNEKYHFFYGGPFSQWCRNDYAGETPQFEIDGVKYNCAEQYMMACKAKLFEDFESLKKIMEAKHPSEQKKLGRKVKDFQTSVWERLARDRVYDANYAKFTQNEHLLEDLMKTEDKLLVEASPYDKIWGIGLDVYAACRTPVENWNGTNWLGEVITQVREDIKSGNGKSEVIWNEWKWDK